MTPTSFFNASENGGLPHAVEANNELIAYRAELRDAAEHDANVFCALLLGDFYTLEFPPFYLALFQLLIEQNADPEFLVRFALGLPRGFAKTTFIKCVICYLVLYKHNEFILLVAANEELGKALVRDIWNMLQGDNIVEVYGNITGQPVKDTEHLKIFIYDGKKIVLKGVGQGTSVRGINEDKKRPDIIVCDDMQTRESALSEVENKALKSWATGTLFKCISPRGANRRIIYIGNMYPGECLLKIISESTEWISLITGAILADGQSLWPELRSVRSLIKEYEHDESLGEGAIWFAEVQNDPLDEDRRLLARDIPIDFDKYIDVDPDYSFITIDPAGFKKHADHNTICVHKVYDGFPIAYYLDGGVYDPEALIIRTYELAFQHGCSLIGVEAVAYQSTLCFWFEKYKMKLGATGINIVEISTQNRTKEARLRAYCAELLKKTYGMMPQVRKIFSFFAFKFILGQPKNKDDYLDSPAMGRYVMDNYQHLLAFIDHKSLDDWETNRPKILYNTAEI